MALARILLGLAISVVCMVALLRQVDLDTTWATLRSAQPGWLSLGTVVLLGYTVAKAVIWRRLCYPARGLHLGNFISALYVGNMVSTLVPLRLGEIVRAYLVTQTEPITFGRSAGAVLVEKVLDVVTLLVFLGVLSLLVPLPLHAISGPAVAALALGSVGLLALLTWFPRAPMLRLLDRLEDRWPALRRLRLAEQLATGLDALSVLRHRQILPAIIFWQVFIWLLTMLGNYLVMVAVGIPAPFAAAVFLTCVTALGMVVPSAPGYIGVFHYLIVLTLTSFGVDAAAALGYAVVLHAVTYGSFLVVGLGCVWGRRYRLSDVFTYSRRPAGPEEKPIIQAAFGGE
ncbi:MAG TPA: lysylphosphatidylglycerol synthase transmembrane domain-containing protein [Chloroflexota bacterium]|jgi:hypothetical protein